MAIFLPMERSGSVGRVLDSGLKGLEFENRLRLCVVSLSKTFKVYPLLSAGSTQKDMIEKLLTGT